MKKAISMWVLIVCMCSGFAMYGASEVELLEQAKLHLFDKKWDRALSVLNEFIERFPKSNHFPLAILYKGKCQEEKKMHKKSILSYTLFLDISDNANLKEEVTVTIIDLYFDLYQKKEKSYLKRIIPYLKSKNRTVKFYAALKLSYVKEKKVAVAAVPVLKQMIKSVDDEELRDRAKIALMRIDPDLLNEIADGGEPEAKLLHIQVYDKKLKKITFSLSIPFMLGKLALEAIPEKEKASLKSEGYDIDRIMKKLLKRGDILRASSEDSVFKIWIE
jgi:hypothetical protein